jgi:hypothetical protein
MNNCTLSDIQEEQTSAAIQIIALGMTVIPLIASEILPFINCEQNGVIHAIVLACSNLKTKERATPVVRDIV